VTLRNAQVKKCVWSHSNDLRFFELGESMVSEAHKCKKPEQSRVWLLICLLGVLCMPVREVGLCSKRRPAQAISSSIDSPFSRVKDLSSL